MAFNITGLLNLQLASGAIGRISSQINSSLRGSAISGISVPVQANTAGIRSITNSIGEATTAFDRFTMQSGLSFKRFAAFSMVAMPFMQLAVGIRATLSQAVEFDRQMTRLRQVSGDSAESIKGVGEEVTRLSTTFGVSSQELIKTAVVLRQADLSAKDTSIALEALAKSALAPNFDSIAQTTEGAIAVMKQFDIEAKDLEGSLGSMNAVAGGFAVEAGDLIEAVRRTGGAFKTSGGDLNELMALFTSVRQTTRESAETISTGLRTIFTRIQRNDTIENLKNIGIELRKSKDEAKDAGDMNLEGRFVGAYEAVRRLSIGLSQLSQADPRYSSVMESLGGYRQIDKIIPLVQQLAISERALTAAEAGRVSLQVSASQGADSYANKINRLQESYLAFGRSLVDSSSFKGSFEGFEMLARGILMVIEAAKPLIPLLTTIATVSIVRNVGTFVGNFSKGATSQSSHVLGRNAGGLVYMASGGTVPGVGNSDTVPANVSPGSFVVKKSSAESLGLSDKPNVMLTPGEHVFAPNEVKTIGIDRLNHMNKYGSLPRFSTGGGPVGGGQNTPERLTQRQLAELLGVTPNSLARTIRDAGIDFQTGANKRKFYDAEQARAFAARRSEQAQAVPVVVQPQPAPVVTQPQAAPAFERPNTRQTFTEQDLAYGRSPVSTKTYPLESPPAVSKSTIQTFNEQDLEYSRRQSVSTQTYSQDKSKTPTTPIQRGPRSPYFPTLSMYANDPSLFTGEKDLSTRFKKKDTIKGVNATDFVGQTQPAVLDILSKSIDNLLSKSQPWLDSNARMTKATEIATQVQAKAKDITSARAAQELSANVQENASGRASDIQQLLALRKSALSMRKELATNPQNAVLSEELTTRVQPQIQVLADSIQAKLGFNAAELSSTEKLPKPLIKSLRQEQTLQESVAAGAGISASTAKEIAESIGKEIGNIKIKVGTNLSGVNVAAVSGLNPKLLQEQRPLQAPNQKDSLASMMQSRYETRTYPMLRQSDLEKETIRKDTYEQTRQKFIDENAPLYQKRLGVTEDASKRHAEKRFSQVLESKERMPYSDSLVAMENRHEYDKKNNMSGLNQLVGLRTTITRAKAISGFRPDEEMEKEEKERARNQFISENQRVVESQRNLSPEGARRALGQRFDKAYDSNEIVHTVGNSFRTQDIQRMYAQDTTQTVNKSLEEAIARRISRMNGLVGAETRERIATEELAKIKENQVNNRANAIQNANVNMLRPEALKIASEQFEESRRKHTELFPGTALTSTADKIPAGLPMAIPAVSRRRYDSDAQEVLRSVANPKSGIQNISVMASEKEALDTKETLRFLEAMSRVPDAFKIISRSIYENLKVSRPDMTQAAMRTESIDAGKRLYASSAAYEKYSEDSLVAKQSAQQLRKRAEDIEKLRSVKEEYQSIDKNDAGQDDRRREVGKRFARAAETVSTNEFSGQISAISLRNDPLENVRKSLDQRAINYKKQAEEQDNIAREKSQKADDIANRLSSTKISLLSNSNGTSAVRFSANTAELGISPPTKGPQEGLAEILDKNVKTRASGMSSGGYDSLAASTKESIIKEEMNKLYGMLIPKLTEEIQTKEKVKSKEAAYALALERAASMLASNAAVNPNMLQTQSKDPNTIAGRLAANIATQESMIDPKGKGERLTEQTRREIAEREKQKLHDQYVKDSAPQIHKAYGLNDFEESKKLASQRFNTGISEKDIYLRGSSAQDKELYDKKFRGAQGNYERILKEGVDNRTSALMGKSTAPVPESTKKSILIAEEERIRAEYVKNVALQIQQAHKINNAEVAREIALERYTRGLNEGSLRITKVKGQIRDEEYQKANFGGGTVQSLANIGNSIKKTVVDSFTGQSSFFGLQAVGSYASAAFAPQQGAIDSAMNMSDAGEKEGRIGTIRTQKAASGLLSGAASGAAIGTMFGPVWGTSIGAAVGATYGFATGLRDASAEIAEARIGYALKKTTEALENFSRGTFSLNETNTESLKGNQLTIEKEISLKSARGASMFGGGFLYSESAFQGQLTKNTKESESNLAGPMMSALTKMMEDQAIATANNANAKDMAARKLSFNAALDLNGGVGRSMLSRVASATQQDPVLLQRKMLESFGRMQENELVKRNRDKGETNVNRTGALFGNLSTAVESASIRLSKMSASVKNLSDFMDSSISSYGGVGLTESLQKPFAAPEEFLSSIGSVLKATKTKDPEVEKQANAIVVTGQILPSIISAIRSQPVANIAAGKDFSIQVGESLRSQLEGKGIDKTTAFAMSNTIQSQIGGEDFNKVLKESGQDMGKLIDRLLGPMSEPLKQSFSSMARNLDERAKTFSDGLTELANRTKSAGEMMDKVSVLRGAATRNVIGTAVRSRRITEEAGDSARFDVSNQMDLIKQQRLTGFGGGAGSNPDAIASALASVFKEIKTAEKKVDETSKSGDIKAQNNASIELTGLKLRASDLNQALRNLADTTDRNAVAQEKLSKIQSERESRQSLGVRYATANLQGRQEMDSSFKLLTAAARMGTAASFSVRDQNKIFGLLSSLSPQMTMRGLGGATVKDVSAKLLSTTFGGAFDLDPQSAAIEKSLEGFVQKNYDTAVHAAQLQVDMQRQIQSEFFGKLQSNQDGFISQIAKVMEQNARMMQESLRLQAQSRVGDLTKQVGESSILGKLGVKTEEEFQKIKSSLAKPGGNIQGIFDASKEKREYESTANEAKGKTDGFASRLASSFGGTSISNAAIGPAAATINTLVSELGFTKDADRQQIMRIFSTELNKRGDGTFQTREFAVSAALTEAIEKFSLMRENAAETKIAKNKKGLEDAGVISPDMIAKIVNVARENADDVTLTSIKKSIEAVDATTFKFDELQKKLQEAKDQVEKFNQAIAAGGPPPGRADGGVVRFFNKGGWGAGGSSVSHPSDTVNARINPKEFVVSAGPAQQHKNILEKINGGEVMRYAEGGVVGQKNLVSEKDIIKNKIEVAKLESLKKIASSKPENFDKAIEDARLSIAKASSPEEARGIEASIEEAKNKIAGIRKESVAKRKKAQKLDPSDFEAFHSEIRQLAIGKKLKETPDNLIESEISSVLKNKKEFEKIPPLFDKHNQAPEKIGQATINNDISPENALKVDDFLLKTEIGQTKDILPYFGSFGEHRGWFSLGLSDDDRFATRRGIRAKMTDEIIRKANDQNLGIAKYPLSLLGLNWFQHAYTSAEMVNKKIVDEHLGGDVDSYLGGWYAKMMNKLSFGKKPEVFAKEEIAYREKNDLVEQKRLSEEKAVENAFESAAISSLFDGNKGKALEDGKKFIDPKRLEEMKKNLLKSEKTKSWITESIETKRGYIAEYVREDARKKKQFNRKPDFTEGHLTLLDMSIKTRDAFNNLNTGMQHALLSDMSKEVKIDEQSIEDMSDLSVDDLSSMISSKSKVNIEQRIKLEKIFQEISKKNNLNNKKIEDLNPAEKIVFLSGIDSEARDYGLSDFRDLDKEELLEYSEKFASTPNFAVELLQKTKAKGPSAYAREAFLLEFISSHLGIPGNFPKASETFGGLKFASGGLVPGTGNSDSVRANLPVGSYVVRKSSVNSIGHNNLASMPHMASGGVVPAMVMPGEHIFTPKEASKIGLGKLDFMNRNGRLPGFAEGGAVNPFQKQQINQMGINNPNDFFRAKNAEEVLRSYEGDIPKMKVAYFQQRERLRRISPKNRVKEEVESFYKLHNALMSPELIAVDNQRHNAAIRVHTQEFAKVENRKSFFESLERSRNLMLNKKAERIDRMRAQEEYNRMLVTLRLFDPRMVTMEAVKFQRQRIRDRIAANVAAAAQAGGANRNRIEIEEVEKRDQKERGEANNFHIDKARGRIELTPKEIAEKAEKQRIEDFHAGKRNPHDLFKANFEKLNNDPVTRDKIKTESLDMIVEGIRQNFSGNEVEKQKKISEAISQFNIENARRANNNAYHSKENQEARHDSKIVADHLAGLNDVQRSLAIRSMRSGTYEKSNAYDASKWPALLQNYEKLNGNIGGEKDFDRRNIGYASGGFVGGFGGGDSVPALLEPGELVVPRRQVKKFASGGIVGGALPFASGGEVNGGSPEMLDSASRFAQAATQISQGLSGFSTAVNMFGDSVGSFGAFVDKFDEAVSKMPGEITLSGANDVSVNIMGQDSIVKAVTEALGPMIADAIRNAQPVEQRAQ
jgi:TP901 family phage tail tape measure protein